VLGERLSRSARTAAGMCAARWVMVERRPGSALMPSLRRRTPS
jgi:hypothetical protein